MPYFLAKDTMSYSANFYLDSDLYIHILSGLAFEGIIASMPKTEQPEKSGHT